MKHDYGYIKRTEGADGEQIDVFSKQGIIESPKVFIVDQVDPGTSKFDEHKVIMGAESEQEARQMYLDNYEKGWKGLGSITEMESKDFKEWVKNGKQNQPLKNIIPATETSVITQENDTTEFKIGDRVSWIGKEKKIVEGTIVRPFGKNKFLIKNDEGKLYSPALEKLSKQENIQDSAKSNNTNAELIENIPDETNSPMFHRKGINFPKNVDRFLKGKMRKEEALFVSSTPKVLQALNVKNFPVIITQRVMSKVIKGKHKDKISIESLKSLPEKIADPIMIFNSKTHPDESFVLMLDMKDRNGKTVIAPIFIEQQRGGLQVNSIGSIYGKDKNNWFLEQLKAGRALYINKTKSHLWLSQTGGLYLPKVRETIDGFTKNILTEDNIVKDEKKLKDRKNETINNFPNNYSSQDIKNNIQRGKKAMEEVIHKETNVINAMYRPDIGSISFYWGKAGNINKNFKGGYGISHIIEKCNWEAKNISELQYQKGEDVAHKMVEVIAKGVPGEIYQQGKKIDIKYNNYQATLLLNRFREKKIWLLTGFKIISSDGTGGVQQSNQPYARQPYKDMRSDVGAEVKNNIKSIEKSVKKDKTFNILYERIGKYLSKKLPEDMFSKPQIIPADINKQCQKIGEIFGKKVVFFKNARPDIFKFNGISLAKSNDTVFIDIDSKTPHKIIVGHELFHEMRKDRPDLYKNFFNQVKDIASKKEFKQFAQKLLKISPKQLSTDKLSEEFLADFVGGQMTNPEFWDAFYHQDPSLFKQLYEFIKKFFNKLINNSYQYRNEAFFKDIKAARDAAASIMEKYANSQQQKNKLTVNKDKTDQSFNQSDIMFSRDTGDVPGFISRLFHTEKDKSLGEIIVNAAEQAKQVKTKQFRDAVITQTLDRMHPIKEILGDNVYKLYRLTTGEQAIFSMFMEHGKLEWDNSGVLTIKDRNNGVLPFLRNLGPDWKKLFYWVSAKRGELLEKQGRENWLTKTEREKIFEWAGAKDDVRWLEAARKLKEFNSNVLDIAENSGLINHEERKIWEQEFFIPFYRIFENEETREEYLIAPSRNRKFLSSQIKRLTGAEKQLGDPLENLMRNWMHLISTAIANKARSEAFDYAQRTGLDIITEIKANKIFTYRKSKDGKVVFVSDKKNDKILSFQRNGKPVYFEVNDAGLFNALSGLNVQKFDNIVVKSMNLAKQTLTFGVTITPAFRVANLLRDTLHTAVINKSFKPFADSYTGFMKAMREDSDYIEFMASGAGFGSSYFRADNPKSAAKFIERILKKEGQGAKKNILDSAKKMYDFWEKIGAASENAARVMIFTKSKKEKSLLDAAFESKDLLDFTMSGTSDIVQFLIRTIPFLNARMQGLYKLGKTATNRNTRKDFFVRGMIITVASAALLAMYDDDDRYKELEDWDKWSYYHFWIGKQHFRIPKPFEVGAIFSSFPEAALSVANGKEEIKFLKDFVRHTVRETFSINTPQLFTPIIEQWANKNMFTKRAIVPMSMQRLKPSAQHDVWTSRTMQFAGEFGISPKRADALVKGYFGTLGTGALMASDILVSALFDFPETPTMGIKDYPGIGRFIRGSENARNTKYQTRFYELAKEIDAVVKTVMFYRKIGDIEKAQELHQANIKKFQRYRAFNKVKKRLSDINKKMRNIYYSSMNSDQKRDGLNKLYKIKNDLLKQSYESLSVGI